MAGRGGRLVGGAGHIIPHAQQAVGRGGAARQIAVAGTEVAVAQRRQKFCGRALLHAAEVGKAPVPQQQRVVQGAVKALFRAPDALVPGRDGRGGRPALLYISGVIRRRIHFKLPQRPDAVQRQLAAGRRSRPGKTAPARTGPPRAF